MSQRATALLAVPLIALAWYAGYRSGRRGLPSDTGGLLPVASRPGTPAATFDGASISVEEVKAQIEEQAPFVRARYSTPEGKREFLDNLVRFELLAREAQRKGYDKDPDVVTQYKRSMVGKFVQREFEEPQQKQAIPEPELRAYYDAHLSEYVRPERVRVAHVFFEAPAADAPRRKAQRAAAEAALAEVREKDAKDFTAFGDLARRLSEDAASKPLGGDLQFLSKDDLARRAGAEVAEAAFGVKDTGRLLDRVVETPQGLHLVKLLGRENALDLKFEGVRDSIRSRLVYERRAQAYRAFVDEIGKRAGLTVDADALQAITIAAGAPAQPPGAVHPASAKRPGAPPLAMPPPGAQPQTR